MVRHPHGQITYRMDPDDGFQNERRSCEGEAVSAKSASSRAHKKIPPSWLTWYLDKTGYKGRPTLLLDSLAISVLAFEIFGPLHPAMVFTACFLAGALFYAIGTNFWREIIVLPFLPVIRLIYIPHWIGYCYEQKGGPEAVGRAPLRDQPEAIASTRRGKLIKRSKLRDQKMDRKVDDEVSEQVRKLNPLIGMQGKAKTEPPRLLN